MSATNAEFLSMILEYFDSKITSHAGWRSLHRAIEDNDDSDDDTLVKALKIMKKHDKMAMWTPENRRALCVEIKDRILDTVSIADYANDTLGAIHTDDST